jgi:hypothetical protein
MIGGGCAAVGGHRHLGHRRPSTADDHRCVAERQRQRQRHDGEFGTGAPLTGGGGGPAGAAHLIIEMNIGRPTPEGGTWTGGVFPAGMTVLLPSSSLAVPVAGPAAVAAPSSGSSLMSFASGLGTALLLSAGAVSVLEARRRRRSGNAGIGARLPDPSPAVARTEAVLRSLDAPNGSPGWMWR